MDVAYPAYDTYNNQVGFPLSRRPSMYSYPSDHTYDPAMNGGIYSDVSLEIMHMECHTDYQEAWLCGVRISCLCTVSPTQPIQPRYA